MILITRLPFDSSDNGVMKIKRTLLLLLAIILVPGGILLLLPIAARLCGGIISGLRSELLAVGVVIWLILKRSEQADSPILVALRSAQN